KKKVDTETPPPSVEETAAGNDKASEEIPPAKKDFVFNYNGSVFGNIPELPTSAKATTGILVELDSGNVLWAKAPKRGVPIASMTKMMTSLLAFEDLKNRSDISLESPIQVSKTAMMIGGSQLYLDIRETFPLGDLLKAVMIMSANDASELVAEFLSGGNTYEFIARMNRRAQELKMPMTKFYNPHGLPGDSAAEDNISSPEGMVILAKELLEYPQAVEWASTKIDKLPRQNLKNPSVPKEPSMLKNHNRLIGVCPGVNGMKTGFIRRSGFCVTVTCERGGKKMAAVVTGFKTQKERDAFVMKLLDWGYKRSANSSFDTAKDNLGTEDFSAEDIVIPK
nr:D-alanyl-D-alanine carboxypeptidase family protein [Victivallales bacterium]